MTLLFGICFILYFSKLSAGLVFNMNLLTTLVNRTESLKLSHVLTSQGRIHSVRLVNTTFHLAGPCNVVLKRFTLMIGSLIEQDDLKL